MALEDEIQLLEQRAGEVGDQVRELESELRILRAEQARLSRAAQILRGSGVATRVALRREHGGKYRPLWQWLRAQQDDLISTTFSAIEGVLGFELPPSSRRHLSHWHGYEGSAVARAIQDAGFRARNVDIGSETVELLRVGQLDAVAGDARSDRKRARDEGDSR
jgi:hypothetical protein